MSAVTKQLGIAVIDFDAGRITAGHLLDIFQEAIDNGDVLEAQNRREVLAAILPLVESGVLRSSKHLEQFRGRTVGDRARYQGGGRNEGQPSARGSVNQGSEPETPDARSEVESDPADRWRVRVFYSEPTFDLHHNRECREFEVSYEFPGASLGASIDRAVSEVRKSADVSNVSWVRIVVRVIAEPMPRMER